MEDIITKPKPTQKTTKKNIELEKKIQQIQQLPDLKDVERKRLVNQERFLGNLELAFGIITTACKATGINRATYYEWMLDEQFKARVEDVSEVTKDMIESKGLEKVMEGSDKMIIYYLSTKCKDRGYVQEKNHNVTAEITQQPNIDLDILSDDEKALLAKIYGNT